MSYRFKREEPVQSAVRRVALERVDRALEALAGEAAAASGVHEARKRFKEIRALLRMLREPLGETFAVENACFRELGRQLSAARDAEAMVETLDRLVRHFPTALEKPQREAARAGLEAHRAQAGGAVPDTLDAVRVGLRQARGRIEHWTLGASGFRALGPGLRKTYRDGQRRFATASAQGTDGAFHEWRKRIKDHWYHTRLLRDVWGPVMAARQHQLKVLSDLVGDDHDLAVLRGELSSQPGLPGDESLGRRLMELAGQYQVELRRQAQPLGRRIYAEKPGALVARLDVYWTVWREAGEPV